MTAVPKRLPLLLPLRRFTGVRPVLLLVVLLFAAQASLWHFRLARVQPRLDIVPSPPTRMALQAAAFGDEQALFRTRALELQAFGDAGGRSTPLSHYDYAELTRWFDRLDDLEPRSGVVPTIAAFVFGQTRDPAQLRQIVDYLRRHAQRDLARQFRWTAHAAMLAAHTLGDLSLALDILADLDAVKAEALPTWVRAMPAYLRAQRGQERAAIELFQAILGTGEHLSPSDRAYLVWQIDRLEKRIAQSAGTGGAKE